MTITSALVVSALIILFGIQFVRFQNHVDADLERIEAKIDSIKSVLDQKK
jgi:hypothetical protein